MTRSAPALALLVLGATIATIPAIASPWAAFLGAPGPSFPAVSPSGNHALVLAESASSAGVAVTVGALPVERLAASLYCHPTGKPEGYVVLAAVSPWPAGHATAGRSRVLPFGPTPGAGAPCVVVVSWAAGPWAGGIRQALEAPATAKAAATSSAWPAPAASAEYVGALPYRIRMDPDSWPRVPMLEVCYLSGAQTRPNGRNDHPAACPDPRPTVDLAAWCAAIRTVPAEGDVLPSVVAAIRAAALPVCR
jgi:hypothetical protein